MRYLFLLAFCISIASLFAQDNRIDAYCIFKTEFDSVHVIKKLEKLYKKNRKGSPANFFKRMEIAYALANYWERGNDSLNRIWLRTTIDDAKKHYSKGKNAEQKAKTLYIIAVCYFRLGIYRDAEAYFAKTIKIEYGYECKHYYYARCLLLNGNYETALAEFKQFNLETKIDVSRYIKTCEEKLKSIRQE